MNGLVRQGFANSPCVDNALQKLFVRYTIFILCRPWLSGEQACKLFVKVDQVLCVFPALVLVLKMDDITGTERQVILKLTVFKRDGLDHLLSTCASFHATNDSQTTPRDVGRCVPRLWVSFMLAFIPWPGRRINDPGVPMEEQFTHQLWENGYDKHPLQ